MRVLLWIVGISAALWSGYWFVGAMAMEQAVVRWLDDRRDEGWVAETTAVHTRGFPNRFDTTVEGLDLADPETGVAWTAPFFQVLALTYKPYHVIAVWPESQTLAFPDQKVAVGAEKMQGSIVFVPETALTVDRTQMVMDAVTLVSDAGWRTSIQEGRLAARRTEGKPLAYDVGFRATDVSPSGRFLDVITAGSDLPDTIEEMRIDATVAFDAPLDRHAIEDRRPQPTSVELKILKATWGNLDLQMTGTVDVDDRGYPDGAVAVQARNWRDMLDLAVRADALPRDLLPTAERALAFLAGLSGNPETIDASLNFRNGLVAFGPLPLGPAPRLVLR
ncbi:MAG: DUF2125 domain-containing protein [Pseudomonadota bacterium]